MNWDSRSRTCSWNSTRSRLRRLRSGRSTAHGSSPANRSWSRFSTPAFRTLSARILTSCRDWPNWPSDLPEFASYRPVQTVAEFQRSLRRELDFGREERNLQQFHARFRDNPHIQIPQPISELCTPRVLTMELLEGIKLSELDRARRRTIRSRRDRSPWCRPVSGNDFRRRFLPRRPASGQRHDSARQPHRPAGLWHGRPRGRTIARRHRRPATGPGQSRCSVAHFLDHADWLGPGQPGSLRTCKTIWPITWPFTATSRSIASCWPMPWRK